MRSTLAGAAVLALLAGTAGTAVASADTRPDREPYFKDVSALIEHDGDLDVKFKEVKLDHESVKISAEGTVKVNYVIKDKDKTLKTRVESETLKAFVVKKIKGEVTLEAPEIKVGRDEDSGDRRGERDVRIVKVTWSKAELRDKATSASYDLPGKYVVKPGDEDDNG